MTSLLSEEINTEILNQFILELSEENEYQSKAKKLKQLATLFSQNQSEFDGNCKSLFLDLLAKVPPVVNVLMNFDVNGFQENIELFKEEANSNIKCTILCLESIKIGLHFNKTIDQLLSILQTSITILHQCYTHCKDSETLYGDLFEEFTDQLGDFFNEVQDLQSLVILEFERLLQFKIPEKEVHTLVIISSELGRLSDMVSSLDTVIGANLWRTFMKIVSHFSSNLCGKLQVHTFRDSLSTRIINSIEDFRAKLESDEEISDQELKIFFFQLNLVMKLSHLYPDSIDPSCQIIRNMLFEIFEILILCYNPICEGNTESITKMLTNTVSPMISIFMSNKAFLCSVFNSREAPDKFQVSHLLLHMAAISYLTAQKDSECMECIVILRNTFTLLQKNKDVDDLQLTSIKLPMRLFNHELNTKEESIYLFEHVYQFLIKLSNFLPDSELENLEDDVINFLHLSSSIVSLLISDFWIYRLRRCSVKNLKTRCITFAQKAFRLSPDLNVRHTVKRLFKFLPSEQLVNIFREHESLRTEFLQDPSFSTEFIKILGIEQKFPLMIKQIKNCKTSNNLELIEKACMIMELCTLLVNSSSTADLLRFIEISSVVFKSEVFEIQLAVIKFLSALKEKEIQANDPDFDKIVSTLSSLLSLTMYSKNYIIRNEAFKNYTDLARSIPHPQIFRKTIVISPDLVPAIKSYLTNAPDCHFTTEKDYLKASHALLSKVLKIHDQPTVLCDRRVDILKALLPN